MKTLSYQTLREMQLCFPAHHMMKLYIHKELESEARDLPGFCAYPLHTMAVIPESLADDNEKPYTPRLAIGSWERMMVCLTEKIETIPGGMTAWPEYCIVACSELDSTTVSEVVVPRRAFIEPSFFPPAQL